MNEKHVYCDSGCCTALFQISIICYLLRHKLLCVQTGLREPSLMALFIISILNYYKNNDYCDELYGENGCQICWW